MEFLEAVAAIVAALFIVKALSYIIPEEYEIRVGGICLLLIIIGAAMHGSMVAAGILLFVLIGWIIISLSESKKVKKFIKSIRWDVVGSILLVVCIALVATLMK